jgi:hypothetical protein
VLIVVTLDEILAALAEHVCDLHVGDDVHAVDVTTFAELGILTADLGLVVRLSDGRRFALKLNDYHR